MTDKAPALRVRHLDQVRDDEDEGGPIFAVSVCQLFTRANLRCFGIGFGARAEARFASLAGDVARAPIRGS